jgi:hypothetical protein
MARLFALDQNFPQPIVKVLQDYQVDAELVPLRAVDERMSELDDWELLLALRHHSRPWDGLITTDSSILFQALELSVLIQTRLTLVVTLEAGHNPVRAAGLLFTHLAGISPGRGRMRRSCGGCRLGPRRTCHRGSSSRPSPDIRTQKQRRCSRLIGSTISSWPRTRSRDHQAPSPASPARSFWRSNAADVYPGMGTRGRAPRRPHTASRDGETARCACAALVDCRGPMASR